MTTVHKLVGNNTTYNKVSVTHYIICNVPFNEHVVHTMGRDGSVEGVVYGAVPDVGPVHAPAQVEVEGIPAQPERLPHVAHLCVFNSEERNGEVRQKKFTRRIEHKHTLVLGIGSNFQNDSPVQMN